ncbi:uncharacterized protein V2V93DRAFT_377420 [Kockiozyma suomiensis]|uniref:uncharacterized protein n=1 Tax=Kockiozyma suomiensis TaxID=1337062 RepID=UPI0033439A6F
MTIRISPQRRATFDDLDLLEVFNQNWIGPAVEDIPAHVRVFVLNDYCSESRKALTSLLANVSESINDDEFVKLCSEKRELCMRRCAELSDIHPGIYQINSLLLSTQKSHFLIESAVESGCLAMTSHFETESAHIWTADAVIFRYRPTALSSYSSEGAQSKHNDWRRTLHFLCSLGTKVVVLIDCAHHSIARQHAHRMSTFLDSLPMFTDCMTDKRRRWTVYNPVPGGSSPFDSATANLLDFNCVTFILGSTAVAINRGDTALTTGGGRGVSCLREFLEGFARTMEWERRSKRRAGQY